MDRSPPKSKLELFHVYGYAGIKSNKNLLYNSLGELVYFAAGTVVVEDLKKSKQKFFLGHNDDITCLAMHPKLEIVASGQLGKSPYICIWSSISMSTLSILKDGMGIGVASMDFSSGGSRLISVSIMGKAPLVAWNWSKGKQIASAIAHSNEVFDLQCHSTDENIFATGGFRHIKFWTVSGNALVGKSGIFGRSGEIQTVYSMCFTPDGRLLSGMQNGDIYVWQNLQIISTVKRAHPGGVRAISFVDTGGFLSGGKDGCVTVWDPHFESIGKVKLENVPGGYKGICVTAMDVYGGVVSVGTEGCDIFEIPFNSSSSSSSTKCIVSSHGEGELWGLAVQLNSNIFATSSDDSTLRLWNFDERRIIVRIELPAAARSCAINEFHVAAGLINGQIMVFSLKEKFKEVIKLKDRKEAIQEMKYSPDNSVLAAGSHDNFVDIYSVNNNYRRIAVCKGASSFITHLDFSADSLIIQVNSEGKERLFYEVNTGALITPRQEELAQVKWATWTCILGPECAGIWEKYSQFSISDVNAADVNFVDHVIVSGDDNGLVKLFNFPTLKKAAKYKRYVGHSSHVTNIRFSTDGRNVFSTGGADHAILHWRFIPTGADSDSAAITAGLMTPESTMTSFDNAYLDSATDFTDSERSDQEVDSETERLQRVGAFAGDRLDRRADLRPGMKKAIRSDLSPGNQRQDAPSQGLVLFHSFGYRGYDRHQNLFYTHSGEVVYFVAALGVVMNRDTQSQKFYRGHTDDILCLAVHPNKDIVATGQIGRKPSVHVWEAQQPTNTALSILQGEHTRGICALDFSGPSDGGKKLATIGLDDARTLVVWDWKKGEKLASTRVHKSDVYGVKFNPFDHNKLVTIGDKLVRFWNHVGAGFTSNRATFGNVARLDSMLCIAFGHSAEFCFTGSLSGLVYCWKGNKLERVTQAHTGPCGAIHSLDKGFVTGGKDGIVCLWDSAFERKLRSYALQSSSCTRGILVDDKPPIRSVMLGHGKILVGTKNSEVLELDKNGTFVILDQGHGEGELWGLTIHPVDGNIFATASDDCTVRIWSISHRAMVKIKRCRKPIRCISYSCDGALLAIGYTDGRVAVLDASSLEMLEDMQHRQEEISDIKFAPGLNKYVAVASHDNFVDIYNIQSKKRCGIGRGASSYITHIDWDASGKLLASNSGAKEVLYFEAPSGKRVALKQTEVDAMPWSTLTGVLGANRQGVWPPRCDVTDVNSAAVTSDLKLIATGDDFGFVKLFNYPARGKFAKFRSYGAHSAHVTNVRWTSGDNFLISVGGADTSICVWALRGKSDSIRPTQLITGGDSEESDVESDDAGGYDSDVQFEKDIDYLSKIYADNVRKQTAGSAPSVGSSPETDRKLVASSSESRFSRIFDLSLEYVFGYRGFDCRQNVFFLVDSDVNDRQQRVVYHAAGAGIVLDLSTGNQSFYLEHDDDIISLATNPNPKMWNLVATGQVGIEPTIHIWEPVNPNGPQTVTTLKAPHGKGVCSLSFSTSGRMLASVGVDDPTFTIVVWQWQDATILTKCHGSDTRIFRCEFKPGTENQLVSVGVRHLRFWQAAGTQMVAKRGVIVQKDVQTSEDPPTRSKSRIPTMLSLAFGQGQSGPVLTYTGAMTGDIYVWRENQLVKIIAKAHFGPVFCMFTTPSDGFIVTGAKEPVANGENTAVKLWDAEMNRFKPFPIEFSSQFEGSPAHKNVCVKSVARIRGSILVGTADNEVWLLDEKTASGQPLMTGHGGGELWGLSVHPKDNSIVVSASQDSSVRVWDTKKKTQLRRLQCPAPAQSCAVSPNGRYIAAGLTNGQLLIIAMNLSDPRAALQVVHKIRDRGKSINDVKFSPDGMILAVGGDDFCVDMYNVADPKALRKVGSCKGVTGTVSKIDFSEDGKVLRVADGNMGHKYFSIPNGNILHGAEDQTWHTWTSVVGKETVCFWASAAQQVERSGDVNCCSVSRNGSVVAAGDDHGFVRLAQFPCSTPGAKTKAYLGHSAHVTNVQFSNDDSHLFSAGGDDCCIFVWKCHGEK